VLFLSGARGRRGDGRIGATDAMVQLLLLLSLLAGGDASSSSAPPLAATLGVWPLPASLSCTPPGDEAHAPGFAADLKIQTAGHSVIVSGSVERYLWALRGEASATGQVHTITVAVADMNETLAASTDYNYTIALKDGAGTLAVTAASPFAVAYALETLAQLVHSAGGGGRLPCCALAVVDYPTFVHRGLLVDTGRRFYPVNLMQGLLDGMAASKMNVLHFHLSEQCFRVESKAFPALTKSCAFKYPNDTSSEPAIYSQRDIATLVQYAKARGVRVIPEIDMPGHSGALCASLVDAGLKCCGGGGGVQIEDDPEGSSLGVIRQLLTEMAGLFPDRVLHLGGDETGTVAPCTLNNTKSFEQKVLQVALDLGKTPMGWEEMLSTTKAAVPIKQAIINTWLKSPWWEAAAAGHHVVDSLASRFYLDIPFNQAAGMWTDLTQGHPKNTLLLGGETSMWGDQYVFNCMEPASGQELFEQSILSMVWPRAAVAAGTFYRFDATLDATSPVFAGVLDTLSARLNGSCPCVTPGNNSCTQASKCGKEYCQKLAQLGSGGPA
jgi:hexosaminidase